MEKLKQKVASSSSRVIASLQQAATGNFQQQQQQQSSSQAASGVEEPTSWQAAQLAPPASPPKSEHQKKDNLPPAPVAASLARMMAANATAHLTENERQILLEVFKKEEQFQRDTIKQMTTSRTIQTPNNLLEASEFNRNNNKENGKQPKQYRSIRQTVRELSNHGILSQASGSRTSDGSNNNSSSAYARARRSITPGSSYASPSSKRSSDSHQQNRPASSCSAYSPSKQAPEVAPLGQCRICRKFILANETCHLCSACNQFVCEDCGSYSASNQHWMCSSCRRRATKPAIPADALKELGLNQNSSAVRRMTLRLNQAELKQMALGPGSASEFNNTSSSTTSSSSGSSSQQANNSDNCTISSAQGPENIKQELIATGSNITQSRPTQRSAKQRSREDITTINKLGPCQTTAAGGFIGGHTTTSKPPSRPNVHITGPQQSISRELPEQCDCMRISPCRKSSPSLDLEQRSEARKTLSQPIGGQQLQKATNPSSDILRQPTGGFQLAHGQKQLTTRSPVAARQEQLEQQQQLSRRASVNISDQERRGSIRTGSGGSRYLASTSAGGSQRKQSTAYYATQNSSSTTTNFNRFQIHEGTYYDQQPTISHNNHRQRHGSMVTTPASNGDNIEPGWQDTMTAQPTTTRHHQQQQQLLHEVAPSRRNSNASGGGQQHPAAGNNITLIPIPPDQIHLRRLSDQSNLVRRSSIIVDGLDGISMARNRSHSNIDSVGCANYFYQSTLMSSELLQQQQQYQQQQQHQSHADPQQLQHIDVVGGRHANYSTMDHQDKMFHQQNNDYLANSQQQYQASDSWPSYHQDHHLQYEQQPIANQGFSNHQYADYYNNNDQPMPLISSAQHPPLIQSIITPYAQKHRQSSEDMRSDSSSDIEDDTRVMQTGMDFDNNEQPNEYFAPPRALGHMNPGKHQIDQLTNQPISIPSVSVSEFSSGQRMQQQKQQQQLQLNNKNLQQQQQQQSRDQIMTTPMEINSAIEQAIRKQEQLQQQQQFRTGNNSELLSSRDYLVPRRGSGIRILPKIPGEQQSRSLLDLPYSQQNGTRAAGLDNQLSTLDLPASSPTIRRASAPEGQNIKIVVDDIDGSMMRTGTGGVVGKQNRMVHGAKGELYERLVLYRDDSIDPQTNMSRGFGLHVMGGKIDSDNKLQACVSWVQAGGPADKVGLKLDDKIIEWDGKCLVNMSYEQVADVIESSANIAELLVKPRRVILDTYNTGANYVRSQRRLSQQTECDLKRKNQSVGNHFDGGPFTQNGIRKSDTTNQTDTGYVGGDGPQNYQSGMAGKVRTGTGRKLPQIPNGAGAINSDDIGPPQYMSSGKLSATLDNYANTFSANLSYQQQQQSLSTGELYRGPDGQITTQRMLPNSSALFARNLHSGEPRQTLTQSSIVGQIQQNEPALNKPRSGGGYQQQAKNNERYGYLSAQNEICGLIGLQVSVDERIGQLEISILSAINIDRVPSLDYYVRVKILPESNRFKPCTTQPSCDMNWKETFIFQNFPTQQIQRMALEIGIWVYDEAPRLSTQIAQPICETLISIQSARERNTDFWPLRPPPTSPQARRKSLNDLIETCTRQGAMFHYEKPYESGLIQQSQPSPWQPKQTDQQQPYSSTGRLRVQAYDSVRYPRNSIDRERSSSARNLPTDTSDSRSQPRRASDEMATSSHRLSTRVSPATSRRSISVMNVGDGHTLFTRPSSRLGSQSSILKSRRDSSKQHSTGGSPNSGRYASPNGSVSCVNDPQQQQVGLTPTGRRSSLVGIQSMRGYRSQKNSQSGSTTDQESPLRAVSNRRAQAITAAKSSGSDNKRQSRQVQQQQKQQQQQQHRDSMTTSGSPEAGANYSRRRSSEQPNQLQRKGSFAMQTLRKLKRTMSLNKGTDGDQPEHGGSRRSSSSSELGDDLGLSSRLASHLGSVGKLKLSFVMTKGQLEVDVICAQGLKFDLESTLGIYVKMYLKGKGKSNKRKTRTVVASEAPIFKQIIKYDGSLVDNKVLEVSVWHKQGGLRVSPPSSTNNISVTPSL